MTDERPATENAADAKSVRAAKKRFKQTRASQVEDLRFCLLQPQFRRFANRLIEFAGPLRNGYVAGDQAQFRDGMKNVAAFFIAELESADPNALGILRAQYLEDSKR